MALNDSFVAAAVAGENGVESRRAHPADTVQFIEILQDSPDALVSQLTGRDRVHEFGADTIENLRAYRLGGPGKNKHCYAVCRDDRVLAAIYVYDANTGAIHSPLNLHGNVQAILHDRVKDAEQAPSSLIFYSISNMTEERGMGQILVRKLHAHLTQERAGAVLSTLSPLRSFNDHIGEAHIESFLNASPSEQRRRGLQYLYRLEDPVQKFHMGNGAIIGDIKPCADTIGRTRLMVNYVYDQSADVLTQQARRSREALIATDPAVRKAILETLVHVDLKYELCRTSTFAPTHPSP